MLVHGAPWRPHTPVTSGPHRHPFHLTEARVVSHVLLQRTLHRLQGVNPKPYMANIKIHCMQEDRLNPNDLTHPTQYTRMR